MKLLSSNLLIVSSANDETEVYKRLLLDKRAGQWFVTEAKGRLEAVQAINKNQFCVVLLDCSFPDDDALLIIDEMQSIKPSLPIVILIADGFESLIKVAMQRGVSHYLFKTCINATTLPIALSSAREIARQKLQTDSEFEELRLFANILSQGLKSPARHIQMLSTGLAKRVSKNEELAENCRSLINDMQGECDGLAEMVESLHQYTRVSEGDSGRRLPISLSELVDTAKSHLRKSLCKTDAEVRCVNDARITCQPASFVQLLQHIIENGIKFNESQPPQVNIQVDVQDDIFQIRFVDNGIGIDPEKFEDIFKPFKRLVNSLTCGGSGLGLATSQKIAHSHGGRLYCESQLGSGSTFFVELPLSEGDHLISSPSCLSA